MPRKKEKREGKEEDGKFKRTKSSLSPSFSSGNRPCSKVRSQALQMQLLNTCMTPYIWLRFIVRIFGISCMHLWSQLKGITFVLFSWRPSWKTRV